MTNFFYIGDRAVGEGQPCFIIAEAGVNHNGDVQMAMRLVDVAVAAGADAVKFQKRDLQHLYSAELLDNPNSAEWAFQYMISFLKQAELSDEEFYAVQDYCRQTGIRFMCTPWDKPSLDFLEGMGLEAYKVASADVVNFPLLEDIARTGKPMILSTGMATLDEIAQTVDFLNDLGATFALLHCVSTYPAPFESLNLRFIETLKQFGVPVGYSSHERGIVMPVVAMTLGACIIEKHITLDRTLPGPDHAASLEPQGFERLVRDIRNAEISMGNAEKQLAHMEMMNRQVLRKSLIAIRDLPTGTVITREMVGVKGPGKGLTPQRLPELIGVTLNRDIKADDYFVESDLQARRQQARLNINGLRRTWGLKARFHDLMTILEQKPQLVELHFSEKDIDHAFDPPPQPYPQRLFIHAPEFANHRLLNMSAGDEETREITLQLVQQTIDKAAELQPFFAGGTVGVVIHVGGMTMDEPTEANAVYLRRAIETFKRLDSRGLILLPENLPPRPWYFGGQWHQNIFIRAEEMVEFCQEVGVGMTLDISHAQLYCNFYNVSLADFTKLCLPYTRHLHFADARGIDEEGLQVGEGMVKWDELLNLLAQEDFTWVPEIWNGHLNNFEPFITAVNRLAGYRVL
jgi:N-acetylneuraminate synthase